ncbi:MAG: YfhO family protein [Bacteroidales bacterium]
MGRAVVQRNMYALGNAWFVENVNLVNNADEEIVAVGNFDPENEAIIDKRFEEYLADWSGTRDSTSSIKLVSYEPDKLVYQVDAKQNELAVFSEIYYPKYWDIKIDGKDAEMMRANYVLRAMVIPKGSKEIVFEFIPTSWNLANKVALWSSILVILLLISHISFSILKRKERKKLK